MGSKHKLRPKGLEGPKKNKTQEIVLEALETARDRREYTYSGVTARRMAALWDTEGMR